MLNSKAKLLIISTSKVHGSEYMDYLLDELADFLAGVRQLLFVPYARPSGISHDDYTALPKEAFGQLNIAVKGVHTFDDPKRAIQEAEAVFVGGGNTFLLLKTLYELELMAELKKAVKKGTPYMGSSAGSNISGISIGTSNDMPIVYPPSFDGLGLLPFNLNPHYLDPIEGSTHMGETRETRINEFHFHNPQPVLGLREGSWLRLENKKLHLRGSLSARLFERNKEPRELSSGEVSFLLEG